tara:strand:- start:603 stop:1364 length:762 start_codon:yes stop_codon:yes gene_type:complete
MIKQVNSIRNISIIIPVFNEENNVVKLLEEIKTSLKNSIRFEVIIVDDGSTDNTLSQLKKSKHSTKNITIIKHKKNFGQSYSLRTGILSARYEYICTIDGDGQNNPNEIKKLLRKFMVNSDFNLVIGNRVDRHDKLAKRVASRFAFLIRKVIFNDKTPDTGCAMKVFRKSDFLLIPFFNHMHRFFPILFKSYGGKIVSVPVSHRRRFSGHSKYTNLQRALVGIYDLIGVVWLCKRSYSPKFIEEKKIICNKER